MLLEGGVVMEPLVRLVLWNPSPTVPLESIKNRFPELLAASGSSWELPGASGIEFSCQEMVLAASWAASLAFKSPRLEYKTPKRSPRPLQEWILLQFEYQKRNM